MGLQLQSRCCNLYIYFIQLLAGGTNLCGPTETNFLKKLEAKWPEFAEEFRMGWWWQWVWAHRYLSLGPTYKCPHLLPFQ